MEIEYTIRTNMWHCVYAAKALYKKGHDKGTPV